jgi:PAS domain S-box-containing protein
MRLSTSARRYAWPVATTTVALATRALFDPFLGERIPYATYFVSVTVSTLFAGARAGAVATILGGMAAVYFVLPPRHSLLIISGGDHQLGFALYLLISTMLVFLAHRQRRASVAQKIERQRFETTLASIGEGVIATDTQSRLTFMNPVAAELTEWSPSEAMGQPVDSVFVICDQDTGAVLVDVAERVMREGRVIGLGNHTVLISKRGKRVSIGDCGAPIFDSTGQVVGAVLVFQDVTSKRSRDAELRRALADAAEAQRMLEAIMEHLPEGLVIADAPDGRVRMVSRYAAEATGRSRKELEGIGAEEVPTNWNIYHPDGITPARPEELPLVRSILHGEVTPDEEWILRRLDGETVTTSANAAPIRDAEGRITGGVITWRDIGERKRLEERLRETAKLESLVTLAGGIAHDFNNLLTGVIGNASLLMEELPEGSSTWSFAWEIAKAADRAAHLSRQMLAYSGRGRFFVEQIDLSACVRETLALIAPSIPTSVVLELDLEEALPPIDGDAGQIQQLITNLVINAAESMEVNGGHLALATRNRRIDRARERGAGTEDFRPGMYVSLEVSDTGCGMDEKTSKRIFEPFFTTKFTGRGLGLAAVQGIVRGHNGFTEVDSVPGQGTTFRILFPAGAAVVPQSAGKPVADRGAAQGAATVLIIDDEEIVRSTAANAIRRIGYAAVAASNGAEGIEVFRTLRDRIAVVLLDMTMPGLSGEETLEGLRTIRPGVPIVVSTGYSEAEAQRRFALYKVSGFLYKPYTLKTIAEKVRAATAG